MTSSARTSGPVRRTATLVACAVLAGAGLTGCTGGDADGSGGSGGQQGFVSREGVYTTLDVADRRRPGEVSGTTLDGRRVSLADYRGTVVVVNVWGSWCPPCRQEAPALAQAARELGRDGVVFLGIDSRDPEQTQPRAFERRNRMPYPSIYDPDGRTLLAFHGTLPPNAIPSTVVIDRQGRVAASVLGRTTRTTLVDLVQDATGEGSA